jgi:hypothetical protein
MIGRWPAMGFKRWNIRILSTVIAEIRNGFVN